MCEIQAVEDMAGGCVKCVNSRNVVSEINGFPKEINRNSPPPQLPVGVAMGGVAVEAEFLH